MADDQYNHAKHGTCRHDHTHPAWLPIRTLRDHCADMHDLDQTIGGPVDEARLRMAHCTLHAL